jgi:hypothetical protein
MGDFPAPSTFCWPSPISFQTYNSGYGYEKYANHHTPTSFLELARRRPTLLLANTLTEVDPRFIPYEIVHLKKFLPLPTQKEVDDLAIKYIAAVRLYLQVEYDPGDEQEQINSERLKAANDAYAPYITAYTVLNASKGNRT